MYAYLQFESLQPLVWLSCGIATGYWATIDDVTSRLGPERIFSPIAPALKHNYYQGWQAAVKATLFMHEQTMQHTS